MGQVDGLRGSRLCVTNLHETAHEIEFSNRNRSSGGLRRDCCNLVAE